LFNNQSSATKVLYKHAFVICIHSGPICATTVTAKRPVVFDEPAVLGSSHETSGPATISRTKIKPLLDSLGGRAKQHVRK